MTVMQMTLDGMPEPDTERHWTPIQLESARQKVSDAEAWRVENPDAWGFMCSLALRWADERLDALKDLN